MTESYKTPTMATDVPEIIEMRGGRFDLVARMGTADTDTVLFRTRMAAGKTVRGIATSTPECFYVLNGRIEVFLVDERPCWHVIEANHSLLITDGVKHAVRTTAHEPADLVLATNNRLARYFREAGRPVMPGAEPVPPTPEDIQRIIRVSEAYGYWIASPAESAAITRD